MENLFEKSVVDRGVELIRFFESKGYTKIKKADVKGYNDMLFAEKDGQECFIKKFQNLQYVKESGWERANNELVCYANLPKDLLIDTVELNAEDHYVVLKKEILQDLEVDENYVATSLEIGLNRFPQIDASFLPATTWEYYEELFEKIKDIEKAGLIDNAKDIVDFFQSKKELIENAEKIFSHQDFSCRNIKRVGDEVKIFDFEFSRCDNAMCDMATLFFDVREDVNLSNLFQSEMAKSELYNKDLFNLMLVRRAVFIVSTFLSKKVEMNDYVRKNVEIIRETSSQWRP